MATTQLRNTVKKIYLLVIIALAGMVTTVSAQDILQSSLSWSSSANTNQADNATTSYSCSFITVNSQSINWSQQSGTDVTTYTVNSVDGTWSNVAADGQVVYHVTNSQLSGDFTFSRTGGVLSLHVKLNLSGTPNFDFIFAIDSVTVQP